MENKCEECGTTVKSKPSQPKRFCSCRCKALAQARQRKTAGTLFVPTKPRRGEVRPCETCGAPVYRNKSQQAKGQGRFCSRACADAAMVKDPVIKVCPNCGKERRLKPSQGERIYCSGACYFEAKIKRPLKRLHNGRPAKKDQNGYVMIWDPEHPNKAFNGWQYEHRIVAEAIIGRYLDRSEAVHHLNGQKDDNRPSNLQVLSISEHNSVTTNGWLEQIRKDRAELEAYRARFGSLNGE